MNFYKNEDKVLFSNYDYSIKGFEKITIKEIADSDRMYFLFQDDPSISRRAYQVSSPSLLNLKEENLNLLCFQEEHYESLPEILIKKISLKEVMAINTSWPSFMELIHKDNYDFIGKKSLTINVVGLGDVGGTLLTGLRLLGNETVGKIGIFDKNIMKIKRWEHEIGQIHFDSHTAPDIVPINEDELFDCDIFVFTVAVSVPPVGGEIKDVRMVQLEKNSKIVSSYAKMARGKNFKGIFAVMSDPVDQLCQAAFEASNQDDTRKLDYLGLAPEQIRGYGLGVMHARAVYYSKKDHRFHTYLQEGRAFGPHGEGLVIANSIKNYDDFLSQKLTSLTVNANLEVRACGFKPYIAPAMSSGCFGILATLRGDWHYSSSFIGGTFMGCKNRLTKTGIELERNHIPSRLMMRLQETYNKLSTK